MYQQPLTSVYQNNGWRQKKEKKSDRSEADKDESAKVKKTLDSIGKVIGFVCKHKDKVMKILSPKRYNRNFLQTEKTKKKESFAKKFKQLKNIAKKLKNMLKSFKSAAKIFRKAAKKFKEMQKCLKDLKAEGKKSSK